MDNRSWSSGASASPPSAPASPSVGYPTAGDPQTATPATKGGAFWFHQIGEELRAVLTAAGITPSTANNAQLLEAIQRMIDAQSGNYALDTGVANAYVVALNPAITAYADGMTVRVKIANTNTGASTLDAGGGVVSLVNDVGGALANGDVPAASIFGATYIASAGKFYIASLVQSQGDARYAALAGLATQLFSVAAATADAHAVNRLFADARYASLAGLITQAFSASNFKSGFGISASFANNTFGTLFAGNFTGLYIVTISIPGASTIYSGEALIMFDPPTFTAVLLQSGCGSACAIQLSGMNVQARQTSGGSSPINYSYLKIG